MADLYGVLAGVLLEGGAHALGVVHGERHGLFLVDMLAGGDGGGEVLAVQVLRGGDQDGVDVLVFQQVAIVEVGLGVGRDLLDIFQAAGVDVGSADAFHVLAGERLLEDLGAAGAGTDDAEADALVGAQGVAGCQRAGQTGGDIADEITARLHGNRTPCVYTQLYTVRVRSLKRKGRPAQGSETPVCRLNDLIRQALLTRSNCRVLRSSSRKVCSPELTRVPPKPRKPPSDAAFATFSATP